MAQLELYDTIAKQYEKFGFRLERCLMTAETLAALSATADQTDSFLGVPVDEAPLDALWVSRPSAGQTEAWEIRLVSTTPLSLLEKIPAGASETVRQTKLKEMEARLLDLISRRREAIEQIIADNMPTGNGVDDDEDDDDFEDDFDDDSIDDPAPDRNSRRGGNGHAG